MSIDAVRVLVLPPHPISVQAARAFVTEVCLKAGVVGDPRDVAVLLTSETVTNAIIHARSETSLTVTTRARSLLIEVTDDDPQVVVAGEQSASSVGGRGLSMLDVLAESWGVENTGSGKSVWFHVGVPDV